MNRFYAVAIGRHPGIYTDWPTAHQQVDRFPRARYRAFSSRVEAQAYLDSAARLNVVNEPTSQRAETIVTELPSAESEAIVYTDGSCVNSRGGYAVVDLTTRRIRYGQVPLNPCTNQKAELYAIYQALVTDHPRLRIRTDSQYAIKSLTEWIITWRRNGWKTSHGTPVENRPLIEAIANQMAQHGHVTFEHVRGHQGEAYNELADTYANRGRESTTDQTITY